MGDRGWRWTDAHFCSLSCQTNVYGLAKLNDNDDNNKLLVSSLDGKVISVEYHVFDKRLTPCTKEIQFTYIPGDAEIVSVDVFKRKQDTKGIKVGITFIRIPESEKETKPACQFLNLYSASEAGDEANLDAVAQSCQSLQIDFIPYQLMHTDLIDGNSRETVFLLSGGDNKIHMYRETEKGRGFQESITEEFFPEFEHIPSSVLNLQILYLDNYDKRLTVMGHQNGLVQIIYIDVPNNSVLQTWTTEHDSPVTSVQVFTPRNYVKCPSFLDSYSDECFSEEDEKTVTSYCLLVTSALEPAVVYKNILISGFEDSLTLPNSEKFDSTLCSCVVDIDFDGENELLIGTYGQELLAYKYFDEQKAADLTHKYSQNDTLKNSQTSTPVHGTSSPKKTLNPIEEFNKHRHRSDESNSPATSLKDSQPPRKVRSQEDLSLCDMKEGNCEIGDSVNFEPGFKLLWQRSFPCPVVGLDRVDIMGDGMDDLVVVTLKGMHILQPDLREVAGVCLERLRGLCESAAEAHDAYYSLQTETF